MRLTSRRVWSLLLALWVVSVRAAAQTGSAPEQVELRYVAAPGCPGENAFVNEVAARIRRPIEWARSSAATQIVVTLGQADDHATGTLEVMRRATEPTRREFVASSCGEVGSALALVVALTLDPNARTEPLPPPTASSAAGDAAPAAPAAPPAKVEPEPPPPKAAPSPVTKPAAERASGPASYVVWLGPAASAAIGYAPEPLITFGLSLGARAAVRRGFSPSFQLTPQWGKTGSTGPSSSDGTFAWAMARLEACPTELRVAAPLALEACAAAEVGRLGARGADAQIDQPVSVDRWWMAAGATLSLHYSVGRWFVRLGAHGLFPATRDVFVFHDPDKTVHQAGVFVYGANLGLGFELGR